MSRLQHWKHQPRVRWTFMPPRQKAQVLTGLITLGATLGAIAATSHVPAWGRDAMTGLWTAWTVFYIGWLVKVQMAARRKRQ